MSNEKSNRLNRMWPPEYRLPTLLVLMSLVVAGFSLSIVTDRPLTSLEDVLLRGFALIAGLTGSYLFGRQHAKNAAKEIVKPYARSAFRRLLSLYQSLSRVATEIKNYRITEECKSAETTLARLEAIVVEQLATADHALEDWRDIVPEDVAELEARLRTPRDKRVPDE